MRAKLKEKRRNRRDKQKQSFARIKETAPDQNAINLTSTVLSESQKSLLRKRPSFVPTPSDINWYEVRRDFDKFVNQLRYRVTHSTETTSNQEILAEPPTADNINVIPNPPRKKSATSRLYRSKETKCQSLELFIEAMENDLFNTSYIQKPRNNLNKNEKLALKVIKSWDDKVICVQDKGSRFVVLSNDDYESKVQHQIERSSFTETDIDYSKNFEEKGNSWISKWTSKGVIDNNWKRFITPTNSRPGKIYGLVKTHKVNNPVRVITSGCNTAVESLSIYIEHVLFELSEGMPSRIKDSNHLLVKIDNMNSMLLPANAILVSFDIVNMFPNIDSKSGLDAVKSVLLKRSTKTPPVEYILEGLELCLTCNNSIFDNRNFLQTDGIAHRPHMSCSYSDIAMSKFDTAALQCHFQPTLCKRFPDYILTIWTHGSDTLESFLDYLN